MTKKVTKNHNLLLFTNTDNGTKKVEWDRLVKLTSNEKWEKPFGHKDVGTPVAIDGEEGPALRHERSQFEKVELPPSFCPLCEDTHVEPDKRIARGLIMLETDVPEVHMKAGQTITHIICEDCAEKMAWPDDNDTALILSRPLRKAATRTTIRINAIEYIKSRQLAGQTGSVLGDDTRREAGKDRNVEVVK